MVYHVLWRGRGYPAGSDRTDAAELRQHLGHVTELPGRQPRHRAVAAIPVGTRQCRRPIAQPVCHLSGCENPLGRAEADLLMPQTIWSGHVQVIKQDDGKVALVSKQDGQAVEQTYVPSGMLEKKAVNGLVEKLG